MKTIRVRYAASLKEQRGKTEEAVRTHAASPEELYGELCRVHRFSLALSGLEAAVNDEIVLLNTPLWEGDTVAFFPAFSAN